MHNLVLTPVSLDTLVEKIASRTLEKFYNHEGNSLNLNSQDSGAENINELLGVNELSKMIGKSVPTIYGYTQRNEIPFNKKGKKLYFLKSEILEWIKSGRVKTVSEIEAEADHCLSNHKN